MVNMEGCISTKNYVYKCKTQCDKERYLKNLYFIYIAILSLKRDKLSFYFTSIALRFIQNISTTNAIDALHFVTVLPHYLNDAQKKQLEPLISAIDNLYYITFYKNNVASNNQIIAKLRDELSLKDKVLKGKQN